ncbi:hypothetical protein QJS63_18135 [Pseudomonas juntendi]|nr:hypothetical protein QJS63_18135 [Pseudomonas juntendi]
MVSVPRAAAELAKQALEDDDHFSLADELAKALAKLATQPHPEPIAWMVGTAIWWQKTGAERDSQDRGEPMVPLGPCDSPSEVARLTAQFKEWQASHHRNYCKTADERDELRSQLEQARRLLHTASIRLANWLEPGDDPRKQIIAFLEDTAEPVGTEDQPGFELIGPQLLEWNRSLVQPCILIGHEYGVATKAMKLARQALSGKS